MRLDKSRTKHNILPVTGRCYNCGVRLRYTGEGAKDRKYYCSLSCMRQRPPKMVLAEMDLQLEIERLRRERAQAASLIRSAIEWIYDEETGERAWDDSDYRHALEELRQAIDLLCPEKGGGGSESHTTRYLAGGGTDAGGSRGV